MTAPIECFLVEAVNDRTVTPSDEFDCDEGCDCHESYTETRFDIRRVDNGEIIHPDARRLYQAGPGAMYFEHLAVPDGPGPGDFIFANGLHLIVVLPNGVPWNVDSRAGNCTLRFHGYLTDGHIVPD